MVERNGRKPETADWLRDALLNADPQTLRIPQYQEDHEALKKRVMDIFSRLDEREATTIDLRFGLSDGIPLSQVKTGEKLGCSATTVRRIERSALDKLRHPITPSSLLS
mgnify:CR=1 FL=1